MSTKLGDGGWTGKLETFLILQWQDKLQQYDKLVQVKERFLDPIKRVMLENAVHPVSELRAVENQADQLKTTSSTDLTYVEYSRLVLSAAASYDNELLPWARPGHLARHLVYMHDIVEYPDNVVDAIDGVYDIDIGIDTIQANMTDQCTPGS
jgi:hypothetical protein